MRELERNTPCLVCQGEQYELISTLDRQGEALATIACVECGLVRHRDIPSEAALEEFYANSYREAYHGESTPSPRRVMRAWNNGRRIAGQLRPFIIDASTSANMSGGYTAVEIGAGLGCNVKALEELGCRAEGVEPHAGFQAYAAASVKAKVRHGFLRDMPRQPAFDLVLLIHVIEHLRQPDLDVGHMRDLLRPEGMLYVECPNLAAPFARKSRMFHYAHLFSFTPHALQSLVEQCGFTLVQRFGDASDPNLQMLFRRSEPRSYTPANGYQQMREAIDRYNAVTYFCRPDYLKRSARKFANMAWESAVAKAQVRQLEEHWAA